LKTIVAFDFDGTLTKKDSFLEFIKFAKGDLFFFLNAPYIGFIWLLFKVRILNRDKAKQYIFSHCFKGVTRSFFNEKSRQFTNRIETMLRKGVSEVILYNKTKGNLMVIVSASMENWIKPWADSKGIKTIIATIPEVDEEGVLTGKFKSKNCVNQEKVNRFLEVFPNRDTYKLVTYGDSAGDKELLEFSDESYFNYFK